MKLNSLTLQNFRCFEHLELDFDPQLTVLISENGGGKTAVLDVVKLIFIDAISILNDNLKKDRVYLNNKSDIRFVQNGNRDMEEKLPVKFSYSFLCPFDKEGGIKNYLQWLVDELYDGNSVVLPLVGYFGVARFFRQFQSISEIGKFELEYNELSRTEGYLNYLSIESGFDEFAKWFRWMYFSYRDEQLIALEKGCELKEIGYKLFSRIRVVQSAVDHVLKDATGWHTIEYRFSKKQIVMNHHEYGELPIEMLSDGIRNTIAMVADIAYRACKLNPHLGENAAKETDGVVLIDEVDMFLHPKWQQTILKSLTDAFPKMQFIVTTHSPQVLSTVRRENIRILPEGKMPEFSPLAHESGDALAKIMGTSPQPPMPLLETVRAFEQLVRSGKEETEEAKKLHKELDEKGYQIHESDLTTWRFLAKRKAQKGI